VARLDLDIDGDGTPELFLSQSQTSGSSGAQEWIVYSRAGDESWAFVGIVGFNYDLFKVLPDAVASLPTMGAAGSGRF
jgi:hypothetical protein